MSNKLKIASQKPQVYIFHRGTTWYPIELRNDADAVANAKCNPGTTLVTNQNGKEIWKVKPESSTTADNQNQKS